MGTIDGKSLTLEILKEVKRINVVGSSATGKSTFSRKLSHILHAPHVEMDQLFWKPNWTESHDEEFFSKLETVLAKDSWVLDGNYTRTIPIKWKRVQLVIWLDYSFITTLKQSVLRALSRSWKKQSYGQALATQNLSFAVFSVKNP